MPNSMNITPPVVSTTPGPQWAQEINDILTNVIAEHNHQPAQDGGVQLTQEAINITDELSLNGNQLINANAVGLETLNSAASGSNRLYNDSGDLYYKDGNGTSVRITENGSLSAASFGGISGLSGTNGTATFAGLSTFVWKKDATEYASMENGPIKIFSGNDPAPTNGVNLIAQDAMASNLNITFPFAAPASDRIMVMSSSGEITLPATISGDTYITNDTISGSTKIVDGTINNQKITNRTIQQYKRANVALTTDYLSAGVPITAAAGTYEDVLTIRITTYGRPIIVSYQGAPDTSYAGITPAGLITTVAADQFIFSRYKVEDFTGGGTLVGFFATEKMTVNVNNAGPTIIPVARPATIIVPNISAYTGNTSNTWDITFQVARGAGTQTLEVNGGVLCAYEL